MTDAPDERDTLQPHPAGRPALAVATAGHARAQTNVTAVLASPVVTLTGQVQSSIPVFWSVNEAK